MIAMEENNKNEKKWHLDIMNLIIIGLNVYLAVLAIKWLFFID